MSDLHTMTLYIMVELTFLSEPLCPSVLRRHHIRRRKQSSFLAAVRIPVPAENAPKNEAKILVKLSFADKSHIYPVFTQPTKSKYSHRKSVIGYGWSSLANITLGIHISSSVLHVLLLMMMAQLPITTLAGLSLTAE